MYRILSACLLSIYLALCVASLPSSEQTLLVPSVPHTSRSWEWSDCGVCFGRFTWRSVLMACHPGAVTDIIEIKSLQVSPDPPQPGKNLTVTASGRVSRTIEVDHSCSYSST